jgi:soluble lytic murein transglycosylase-like protein
MILSQTPATTRADVYKYINKNGQVFYTDSPNHGGYKMIIQTPKPRPKPVTVSLSQGTLLGNAPVSTKRSRLPQPGLPSSIARAEYAGLVQQAAEQHGLDPRLLDAVIHAESAYKTGAVSHKGAMGLMQLMPGTAARYGVTDPHDPAQNIFGGARYLSDLMSLFGSNVTLALAAYNAGENNVIKHGNRVPPFDETRNYVSKVLSYYYR